MAPLLRLARRDDVPGLSELIRSENFPVIEIEECLDSFWVVEDRGQIVGCAGIERYGDTAVLRSVVVGPSLRGTGLGVRMTQAALDWARQDGAKTCFLFTFNADGFFARFGFERCTLDEYSADARIGWQYRGIQDNESLCEMLIPMRTLL